MSRPFYSWHRVAENVLGCMPCCIAATIYNHMSPFTRLSSSSLSSFLCSTLSLSLFRMMELATPAPGELSPDELPAGYAASLAAAAAARSTAVPQPDARADAAAQLPIPAGCIEIDGIDISRVNVYQLRSRLAVLPQDPVLYAGSLRYNLDVFGEHSEDRLMWAVERAGLLPFVRGHPAGLGRPIVEGGANCSHGERQLIALCRALLRDALVCIADEATSNVDGSTDAAVQATIRNSMHDRTLIVIAHRLQTIIDSDRVLVLGPGGRVLEYDHPAALLGLIPSRESDGSAGSIPAPRINGTFARMVQDTGPSTASYLKRLALAAATGGALLSTSAPLPSAGSFPARTAAPAAGGPNKLASVEAVAALAEPSPSPSESGNAPSASSAPAASPAVHSDASSTAEAAAASPESAAPAQPDGADGTSASNNTT